MAPEHSALSFVDQQGAHHQTAKEAQRQEAKVVHAAVLEVASRQHAVAPLLLHLRDRSLVGQQRRHHESVTTERKDDLKVLQHLEQLVVNLARELLEHEAEAREVEVAVLHPRVAKGHHRAHDVREPARLQHDEVDDGGRRARLIQGGVSLAKVDEAADAREELGRALELAGLHAEAEGQRAIGLPRDVRRIVGVLQRTERLVEHDPRGRDRWLEQAHVGDGGHELVAQRRHADAGLAADEHDAVHAVVEALGIGVAQRLHDVVAVLGRANLLVVEVGADQQDGCRVVVVRARSYDAHPVIDASAIERRQAKHHEVQTLIREQQLVRRIEDRLATEVPHVEAHQWRLVRVGREVHRDALQRTLAASRCARLRRLAGRELGHRDLDTVGRDVGLARHATSLLLEALDDRLL